MQEKNLVRLSLFLICIALVLVYSVFLDKNGGIHSLRTQFYSSGGKTNTAWSGDTDTSDVFQTGTIITGEENILALDTTNQAKSTKTSTKNTNGLLLSGTRIVYDELESISVLDLEFGHILKGIGSLYLVTMSMPIDTIINRIIEAGGQTKTLSNRREIIQNGLVGRQIIYINLPKWSKKLVVMLIVTDAYTRLVQVDYDEYYKVKPLLKKILSPTL